MEKGANCREDDEDETGAAAVRDGVDGDDLDDPVDSRTGSLGHLRNASLTTKAVMTLRTGSKRRTNPSSNGTIEWNDAGIDNSPIELL